MHNAHNPHIDIFDSMLDVQFSMVGTVSFVTFLTPYFVFHGFDTFDNTDCSVKLVNQIPSSPIRFSCELRSACKLRNELLKHYKELAVL